MKKGIFIQSRMSSSRLKGKMLKSVNGIPLIEFVYERCRTADADIVAVLTSEHPSDDPLFSYCCEKNIPVFRGPLENVLERYVKASAFFGCKAICRVCGDSPFVDTGFIDRMFEELVQPRHKSKERIDYITLSNCLDGFLSEVFTLDSLLKAYHQTDRADDKEHVTKFIKENKEMFKIKTLNAGLLPADLFETSITVDYAEDLVFINKIISKGLKGFTFSSPDVICKIREVRS